MKEVKVEKVRQLVTTRVIIEADREKILTEGLEMRKIFTKTIPIILTHE